MEEKAVYNIVIYLVFMSPLLRDLQNVTKWHSFLPSTSRNIRGQATFSPVIVRILISRKECKPIYLIFSEQMRRATELSITARFAESPHSLRVTRVRIQLGLPRM